MNSGDVSFEVSCRLETVVAEIADEVVALVDATNVVVQIGTSLKLLATSEKKQFYLLKSKVYSKVTRSVISRVVDLNPIFNISPTLQLVFLVRLKILQFLLVKLTLLNKIPIGIKYLRLFINFINTDVWKVFADFM